MAQARACLPSNAGVRLCGYKKYGKERPKTLLKHGDGGWLVATLS